MTEFLLGLFMCFVGGSLLQTLPLKKLAPAILLLAWGGMFLLEGVKALLPLLLKWYGV